MLIAFIITTISNGIINNLSKNINYTVETGLAGIAYYVISRMEKREKENGIIRLEYIFDLIEALKRKQEK